MKRIAPRSVGLFCTIVSARPHRGRFWPRGYRGASDGDVQFFGRGPEADVGRELAPQRIEWINPNAFPDPAMRDSDYTVRFAESIQAIDWDIELPLVWKDYFDEKGELPCYADDARSNQRLRVRTHGILWFESGLPFRSRGDRPVGIYTKDFSRQGFGFLTAMQLYPEETVRIALPTFWLQVRVARVRRITSKCYEVGSTLLHRHDPSRDVFAQFAGDHLSSA